MTKYFANYFQIFFALIFSRLRLRMVAPSDFLQKSGSNIVGKMSYF